MPFIWLYGLTGTSGTKLSRHGKYRLLCFALDCKQEISHLLVCILAVNVPWRPLTESFGCFCHVGYSIVTRACIQYIMCSVLCALSICFQYWYSDVNMTLYLSICQISYIFKIYVIIQFNTLKSYLEQCDGHLPSRFKASFAHLSIHLSSYTFKTPKTIFRCVNI